MHKVDCLSALPFKCPPLKITKRQSPHLLMLPAFVVKLSYSFYLFAFTEVYFCFQKYKMICKTGKICAVQHFDYPNNVTFPVCIPLSFVPGMCQYLLCHPKCFRYVYMNLCVRKPTIWVPTRPNTNQPIQSYKQARSLKFRI